MKFREWYIYIGADKHESSIVNSLDQLTEWAQEKSIHVIEMSAYLALHADLTALREMLPRMVDSIPWASKLEREKCYAKIKELEQQLSEL